MSVLTDLKELCLLSGVSGDEGRVRDYILSRLRAIGDSVAFRIDPAGNIIGEKKGQSCARTRVMVSAHMDEVGLLVTGVTSGGTLRFAAVGGINPGALFNRRVLVGPDEVPGVISAAPIHLLGAGEREQIPGADRLRIDLGAADQKQALALTQPGDYAVFMPCYELFGEGMLRAKALDDRFGCALMLHLLSRQAPYDFAFAFCTQEEVGLRGSAAAAYTLAPDIALVLEATTAADIPGVEEGQTVCALGGGPVCTVMDKATIYDRALVSLAFETAQKAGIPCQHKQAVAGGNDAGAIHRARGGVRCVALSLPTRYIHTANCVATIDDIEQSTLLAPLLLDQLCGLSRPETP